jgi:hypothetical protein
MEASGSKMMYDVTTYDTYPGMDDVGGVINNFFNDPDVRYVEELFVEAHCSLRFLC